MKPLLLLLLIASWNAFADMSVGNELIMISPEKYVDTASGKALQCVLINKSKERIHFATHEDSSPLYRIQIATMESKSGWLESKSKTSAPKQVITVLPQQTFSFLIRQEDMRGCYRVGIDLLSDSSVSADIEKSAWSRLIK